MAESVPASRRYTVAEYLAREDASDERHEYHDGEIIAMAGAVTNHNRITRNLNWRLAEKLPGTPCEDFGQNQRIKVGPGRYCYPDQSIVCHPRVYHPPDGQVRLTNPRVLFDVLSESTEHTDSTEELHRYMGIESLQEYVLSPRTGR